METHEILSKLKEDKISIEEAELLLRRQPFEEMGFAKLDTHRKIRFRLFRGNFLQWKN